MGHRIEQCRNRCRGRPCIPPSNIPRHQRDSSLLAYCDSKETRTPDTYRRGNILGDSHRMVGSRLGIVKRLGALLLAFTQTLLNLEQINSIGA